MKSKPNTIFFLSLPAIYNFKKFKKGLFLIFNLQNERFGIIHLIFIFIFISVSFCFFILDSVDHEHNSNYIFPQSLASLRPDICKFQLEEWFCKGILVTHCLPLTQQVFTLNSSVYCSLLGCSGQTLTDGLKQQRLCILHFQSLET